MLRKIFWPFFIIAFAVVVFRFPSIDVPLDTDSSANAFIARHMIRGDVLYDHYHTGHHLPAIYYTFVLAFKLFGDNSTSFKLLLIFFMVVSAWLIFLMGDWLFDNFTGLLAAVFFVLASSHQYLSGMTAEMELFANLPLIATMFIFLLLLRKNAPSLQFSVVGILAAICVLYKIIFVAPLLAAVFSLLIAGWLGRGEKGNIKIMILRIGSIVLGFLIPLVLVGAYFASRGLWERFMLVFTFGFTYLNEGALLGEVLFPKPFGFPLFMVAMNNIVLLVFGLIGAYRLLRRAIPLRTTANLMDFSLVLWLVVSFALAGLRGGGFAHYVLVVIPPLALMGAIEIMITYQRWQTVFSKKSTLMGITIMIALVFANFFWRNYDLYRDYFPYKLGRISYDEFAYRYSKDRERVISNYIESHTSPNDFIYIWSIHIQPYYFADREPPIDMLWPSYVSTTGSPQRIFDPRTKYIIVDSADVYFRPQWLMDGLAKNYFLEAIIGGKEIYRRISS